MKTPFLYLACVFLIYQSTAFSQADQFVSQGDNVMKLLLLNGTDREFSGLRIRFASDCPLWLQPTGDVTTNLAPYGRGNTTLRSSLMLEIPFIVSPTGMSGSEARLELVVGQEVLGAFKVLLTPASGSGGTSSSLSKEGATAKELESLVEGETQPSVPATFALSQNYPNPFNPTTRIAYSIPSAQFVSLKVYDLLGRHIRTLIDAGVPAGSHTVSWDGTDDGGSAVPSGVYIYRLITASFASTRKMILVR